MLLWFIFAAMTAVATLAVLAPLARARRDARAAPDDAHDLAVYRDQLDELDRDRERGLIGPAEAEAARTEIARRMLHAADAAAATAPAGSAGGLVRSVAVAAACGVPALAVGVYLVLGSPELPGRPLEARLAAADEGDVEAMVARVERHLSANPDDVEGWRVIAPVYARFGLFDKAAEATRRIMALAGPTADGEETLGEMLVAAGGGVVGPDAEAAFERALAADPSLVKARFYRALGRTQSGRGAEAVADYDHIIANSPPDAPWLEAVRRDRADALESAGLAAGQEPAPGGSTPAPGPDAAAVAAAAEMTAEDRSAMIAEMVDRLAARLADDPADADGWQRLIRAYGVLGRTEDARKAYESAATAFAGAPEALAAIRSAAEGVGLDVN